MTLPPAVWSKGDIIDGIVREKYSAGQMEAIHNNYLLALSEGATEGEAFDEFKKMQEWRTRAKLEAEKACNEYQ